MIARVYSWAALLGGVAVAGGQLNPLDRTELYSEDLRELREEKPK